MAFLCTIFLCLWFVQYVWGSAINNCPMPTVRPIIQKAIEIANDDAAIQMQAVRRIMEDIYGGTWGCLIVKDSSLVSTAVHWTIPDHKHDDGSAAFCLYVESGWQYNVFKTGNVDTSNRLTVEQVSLPNEVLQLIFSNLGNRTLHCCRLVCPRWNALISSRHYPLNPIIIEVFCLRHGRELCADITSESHGSHITMDWQCFNHLSRKDSDTLTMEARYLKNNVHDVSIENPYLPNNWKEFTMVKAMKFEDHFWKEMYHRLKNAKVELFVITECCITSVMVAGLFSILKKLYDERQHPMEVNKLIIKDCYIVDDVSDVMLRIILFHYISAKHYIFETVLNVSAEMFAWKELSKFRHFCAASTICYTSVVGKTDVPSTLAPSEKELFNLILGLNTSFPNLSYIRIPGSTLNSKFMSELLLEVRRVDRSPMRTIVIDELPYQMPGTMIWSKIAPYNRVFYEDKETYRIFAFHDFAKITIHLDL